MFDDYYALRDELNQRLERDLLGPAEPEEVIADPPITRYVMGILFPEASGNLDPHLDDATADDYDDTAVPDPGIATANARYPSSMAITFSVDADATDSLDLMVRTARYEPEAPDDLQAARPNPPEQRWRRQPIGPVTKTIPLKPGDHSTQVAMGLELFVRVRPRDDNDAASVTAALINRLPRTGHYRDSDSFFQPQISVTSPDATRPPFVARPSSAGKPADDELDNYRLLYRDHLTFAVGHGCSVRWTPNPQTPDRVDTIHSTFLPTHDLKISQSNPDIDNPSLQLLRLATEERLVVLEELGGLVADYREWISTHEETIPNLPTDLRPIAVANLAECVAAADRISAGISLLDDDTCWTAFRMMNQAMLTLRARTEWIKSGRPQTGPQESVEHRWRPFQLAFVLLTLPGITDPQHEDRDKADLLWFPTGGGKTEAYLGILAFTILYRRLTHHDGSGVTALMRYTLRLLTIQQFERAAALICALEYLRRSDPKEPLGSSPIGIGLWVGKDAAPNDLWEASKSLAKLKSGGTVSKGNPIQLHACPWCGTRLGPADYWVTDTNDRMVIECPSNDCSFNRKNTQDGVVAQRGLPVYLIDEELYRYRPALIIATVDKFASLPWRPKAAELFNLGHPQPPPELIIQDELHLISGPLGTLTGLYETVIDHLCEHEGIPPKLIASTATIRRASAQTEALFNRTIRQFPPSAIDAGQSFFAVEAEPDQRGTRRYVGVMAPSSSHAYLMIRTYATLLQSVAQADAPAKVKDPYWTLVGYFNSLRVLGGARLQVRDDVADYMEVLADGNDIRDLELQIELTSRESSARIPEHLRDMAIEHPDPDALDVILATNMIGVGVDIDRLGLMVVMGQPPSTSEYIQSTSRVGRQFPGLIIDVLNAYRSRDRSHYESFQGYHAALYREVESTSVTPFSPRARDRGLHALVVALARLLHAPLQSNNGARAILNHPDLIEGVKAAILDRVNQVDETETQPVATEIDAFVREWRNRAQNDPKLVYANKEHPEHALLGDALKPHTDPDDPWPTLWSLRDVDGETNLYLASGQ